MLIVCFCCNGSCVCTDCEFTLVTVYSRASLGTTLPGTADEKKKSLTWSSTCQTIQTGKKGKPRKRKKTRKRMKIIILSYPWTRRGFKRIWLYLSLKNTNHKLSFLTVYLPCDPHLWSVNEENWQKTFGFSAKLHLAIFTVVFTQAANQYS